MREESIILLSSSIRYGSKNPPKTFLQRFRTERAGILVVVGLALFTEMIIYDIIVPIMPELLRQVGMTDNHEGAIGMLFAVYSIGFLVATPVFGIWSDRVRNRRVPMIIAQAALTAATLAFALSKSFWILVLTRFLQGAAGAVSWTLGLALLADAVPEGELGSAMGLVFGFNTLGYFVGPLAGGILAEAMSIETPFYLYTVLCVVDLVARLLISPPPPRIFDSGSHSILGWLRYTEVLVISVVIAVTSASFSAFETLLSDYLTSQFGLSLMQISVSMMAFIVPSMLLSYLGGKWADKYDCYYLLYGGVLVYTVAPILMGMATTFTGFLLASAFLGASYSLVQAPTMPELGAIVSRIGSGKFAQVYAISNISYSIGLIAGPLIASYLYRASGFFLAISIFSVPLGLLIPVCWWLHRQATYNQLLSQCHKAHCIS